MRGAGRVERTLSYLGRNIEAVLPLALGLSLSCLAWGAFADRLIDVPRAALLVPIVIGTLGVLVAIAFVAYVTFARADLLRRVRIEHRVRIVRIDNGNIDAGTHAFWRD
jgi:hypothetical protein